jgi:hypothetical protein
MRLHFHRPIVMPITERLAANKDLKSKPYTGLGKAISKRREGVVRNFLDRSISSQSKSTFFLYEINLMRVDGEPNALIENLACDKTARNPVN